MNGIDLINNLIDELNRTRDLLRSQLKAENIDRLIVEELVGDIESDLDRYYDVADSIDGCVIDIDVE